MNAAHISTVTLSRLQMLENTPYIRP